jgi:two-component system, OmpR family, heavy metal sensor histidine kinase CusS
MLLHLSLTSRLTIFFTLVATFVTIGLAWLVFTAANRHFLELDQTALTDKKHLIQDIIGNANSADDLRRRLGEALRNHHGLYVRIKNPDETIIYQSRISAFEEVAPPSNIFRESQALMVWENKKRKFRVLYFGAAPSYAPQKYLQVTVSMDTAHHEIFLSDLQKSFLIYSVAAILLSGLLSWLAAHQGMAPLRAMKKRASIVSGQHMETRMPVDAVPIEMSDLAQELNQMLDRLQHDFQRLSDFSSDLAHELRTPVSNLLTQTQVTLSATRDTKTYQDILVSNAEELQRLARMISAMLFLAKTEQGSDLPNREKFSAALEVQALIEFYEAVAEEKHILLSAIGDGEIQGDRLMFRRAVSNLLSNALRHAPDGGVVRVTVTDSPRATEIAVENSGDEIAPELLPRLFDRFYRADPSRAHPGSDGAGLGLSITRAIAVAHGGGATVESGRGITVFRITFLRHS